MRKTISWKVAAVIAAMIFPSIVFASKAPDNAGKAKILNKTYRMRVPFIENTGQIESKDVVFYAKTFGGTLFVEKDGTLTYSLSFKNEGGVIIKEVLTDRKLKIEGLEPAPTRINYFKGSDQSKWKTDIPSYGSVSLGEVYKGIELKLRAYGNNVEKLFTVLPGESPEIIKVKLEGSKGLAVNEEGELVVITELGPIKFTRPVAFQEIDGKRIEIAASYSIQNSAKIIPQSDGTKSSILNPQSKIKRPSAFSYGFKVGEYNNNYPLVIDPLLASTFIGGAATDEGNSIALAGSGNIYVVGKTEDHITTDYPVTAGVHDQTHNASYDVFVTKLDSMMTTLLASTFIGGAGQDRAYSLALDGSENVYLTGFAGPDYPVTAGVHDQVHNGNNDVFVTKLNSMMTTLLASTFIGGSQSDKGYSIALDGSENIYVVGETADAATDYPVTAGVHDQVHNGDTDVFVTKLNSIMTTLLASTFIGGGTDDKGYSIVLDGSKNIYVTGYATDGYPVTAGVHDQVHNGDNDVFVTKLNSIMTTLLASTFIGGSDNDTGNSIALDGSENIYVIGETVDAITDYPVTAGVHDQVHNGSTDVFVTKLNSILTTLSASTFIGGGGDDKAYAIALDGGSVYVTGAASDGYPTIGNPYDSGNNGGDDVFVSKLNSTLSSISVSTFIGGGNDDNGYSIALDGSGNIYVVGNTLGAGYPVTAGVHDQTNNGGFDVFVSKLNSNLSANSTTSSTTTTTVTSTTSSSSTTTADPATTTTTGQNTTTASPTTTIAPVTTTSSVCSFSIAPVTAEVVSGESVQFTINQGDCTTQNIGWSLVGTIGSNVDQNGKYTAGTNVDFFNKATDVVTATDYANGNITAQASASVFWGCFLLQIYGEDSEEAELLRYFRDNVLNQSEQGQALIKFYYEWSPVIITAMEADEEFRNQIKGVAEGALQLLRQSRKKKPPLIPEIK